MGLISEWSKQNEARGKKPIEMICAHCDGAGLEPDNNPTGIKVCGSCNGHGIVLYDGFSSSSYAPKKDAQRAMEIVNEVRHDSTRIA